MAYASKRTEGLGEAGKRKSWVKKREGPLREGKGKVRVMNDLRSLGILRDVQGKDAGINRGESSGILQDNKPNANA